MHIRFLAALTRPGLSPRRWPPVHEPEPADGAVDQEAQPRADLAPLPRTHTQVVR